MIKRSSRRTPPESEEDWAYGWESWEKAQETHRSLSWLISLSNNWRTVLGFVAAGLAFGGAEIIQKWGLW